MRVHSGPFFCRKRRLLRLKFTIFYHICNGALKITTKLGQDVHIQFGCEIIMEPSGYNFVLYVDRSCENMPVYAMFFYAFPYFQMYTAIVFDFDKRF